MCPVEYFLLSTEKIGADLDQVKDLLGEQVGGPLNIVGTAAVNYHGTGQFGGTRIDGTAFESVRWQSWLATPLAIVDKVSDASGHRIGDEEWYTAAVDWILLGFVAAYMPSGTLSPALKIACKWHTKILFSTGPGRTPSIVYFDFPEALGPDISHEQLIGLRETLEKALALPETAAYILANAASLPIYHSVTSLDPWETAGTYPFATFARPALAEMFDYRGSQFGGETG